MFTRTPAKPPVQPTAAEPARTASEISAEPVRLHWSIDDLLAKDGHRLTIIFTCAAARVDEPAERKLFDEVFKANGAIRVAVVNHFAPALHSAASQFAQSQTAEVLLSSGGRSQWVSALQSAANEVAFMCGLKLLAPFEVEATSPTLQRERLEQMQRIAAERRSADRMGHLARAAELLKQWETLKKDVPSITPGKLLEQVTPADRGMMLDTLLMAGASGQVGVPQPDLWAVSGPYLVRVDVKVDSPQPRLISLPTTAGPLRSICGNRGDDGGQLLIGARSGVIIVDRTNAEQTVVYRHPTLTSEHGFTSVTKIAAQIWACHREGGLVAWNIGETREPKVALSPAQLGGDPKHLTDSGLFAVGQRLFKLSAENQPQPVLAAPSPIVAIISMPEQVLVALEDASLLLLDFPTLEKTGQLQSTGRLSGAALLPWLSSSRLLLNRADGPIECLGLEDQLVTQFTAGHIGMRAVTACIGKVAAMSSDRQRLLLWNAWEGRKTAAEIYLTGITHHRIADVVFA